MSCEELFVQSCWQNLGASRQSQLPSLEPLCLPPEPLVLHIWLGSCCMPVCPNDSWTKELIHLVSLQYTEESLRKQAKRSKLFTFMVFLLWWLWKEPLKSVILFLFHCIAVRESLACLLYSYAEEVWTRCVCTASQPKPRMCRTSSLALDLPLAVPHIHQEELSETSEGFQEGVAMVVARIANMAPEQYV